MSVLSGWERPEGRETRVSDVCDGNPEVESENQGINCRISETRTSREPDLQRKESARKDTDLRRT